MDIVSRLKTFISYLNIPVTQFADSCNIPRPTLSQLLNGRNKKVSDELIGKIHETYPSLSVLWLMFGEGDMLHSGNIEISEPQTGSIFDFNNNEQAIDDQSTPSIDFNKNFSNSGSEKFDTPSSLHSRHAESEYDEINNGSANKTEPKEPTAPSNTITFSADNRKKIVNIIVYYNDNSFESFVPNPNK